MQQNHHVLWNGDDYVIVTGLSDEAQQKYRDAGYAEDAGKSLPSDDDDAEQQTGAAAADDDGAGGDGVVEAPLTAGGRARKPRLAQQE